MKLSIIGSGYVGLVSGAGFAELGHDVVCIDKDEDKIDALERGVVPIYEPGLEETLARSVKAGRLRFSSELGPAIADAELIFIAVGTPTRRGDGHADLRYVLAAAEGLARELRHDTVVVTKSTVPVGTGERLARLFAERRPDLRIEVASNPEFLREGSALEDFLRPDRVVCGVRSETARDALAQAYRPLRLNNPGMLFTGIETAELIKYAANSFLAMKITFINEMVDLCEGRRRCATRGPGDRPRWPHRRKILECRSGLRGLVLPEGYAGLAAHGRHDCIPLRLVETAASVNEQRKRVMLHKIIKAAGGGVKDKNVAVLGVTFKPNTDDMRDSPSLVIVLSLIAEGAHVQAFDPEGMNNARKLLEGVIWADDAYAALMGADVAVLMTEWNQFRALDLARVRAQMRGDVFVDLRNVDDVESMTAAGFTYVGIGKGTASPRMPLDVAASA